MLGFCSNCQKEKEHHARGLCYACYKKITWKPKILICKRCQREREIHAKGLCGGCYTSSFHLDKNRSYYHRKKSGLDPKAFRRVTKECVICGFDKIVDLHYLDKNKSNNSKENLVGLCPNHGRQMNNQTYRDQILKELENRGIIIPLRAKKEPKTPQTPCFLPSFSE